MKDSFLRTPFFLGDKELPSNIFCAPLAGCSDLPYREMTSEYKPGLVYCEMVKMDALIRHDAGTYKMLEFKKGMHPIGAQLCGSKPELAAESARILEDLGFDVIDLNCGCPVDKVTKDGSGSGLLKTPDVIGEIIYNIVKTVSVPVTIKIRLGWDEQHINCVEITKLAESAGAKAICIHGRTRQQGYAGNARWEYIKACKEAANNILVIGNGDVTDAFAAKRLFLETGCDAILVARGTMGQPWIIEDIYKLASGDENFSKSISYVRERLLSHMNKIEAYQNEKRALLDLRRVGCWYLKSLKGARPLREMLNRSKSLAEVRNNLFQVSWEDSLLDSPDEPAPEICQEC